MCEDKVVCEGLNFTVTLFNIWLDKKICIPPSDFEEKSPCMVATFLLVRFRNSLCYDYVA